MPVQAFWTLGSGSDGRILNQEVFTIIFAAIIIGWIIVALWNRVVDNFTYNNLKMDKNSAWDTFLIAIGITIFFIAFVWVIDKYQIVEGTLAKTFTDEDDPVFGRIPNEEEKEFLGTAFSGPRNASIATLFPQVVFV